MDLVRLIQELEVHQVELEIQNEELRSTKKELEASRDRFADLYECAPVGYMDLDNRGLIARSNIAAREMLGIAAKQRLDRRFASLIDPEDQEKLWAFLRGLKRSGGGERIL